MFEPRNVSGKKLNDETHSKSYNTHIYLIIHDNMHSLFISIGIVGEVQLHEYGKLLDTYHTKINLFKQKLSNNYNVRSNPILIEVFIFYIQCKLFHYILLFHLELSV